MLRKKILLLILIRKRAVRKNISRRKIWVRKLYQEREQKGEFNLLIKDLILFDSEIFFQYFRMTPTILEQLLSILGPSITKKDTNMREAVSAKERVCVTLRYLATGDAQTTIATNYRMSPTTVGRIIQEVCDAIWDNLLHKGYICPPKTEKEWKKIAKEFADRWNFPNAVGAIDGKHVVIQAPHRSGSSFFNYKKTHSIVLLAICDAKYKFTLVDIGDSGRQSDGSVYANGNIGYAIENNLLGIPGPAKLPLSNVTLPFVFVGDDAFGLKPHMMKPYPFQNLSIDKRVFNYRLSRARRLIENVFGIATSRFRVFRRPIIACKRKVVSITKAIVALHNFLMTHNEQSNSTYCPIDFVDRDNPEGLIPGHWRNDADMIQGLQELSGNSSNNFSRDAADVRNKFKTYFNNEGAVEWQWDIVTRTN